MIAAVAEERIPGRPTEVESSSARLLPKPRRPLDTTLSLETPEHIALDYQLAGPARRAAAYGIDLLIRGAVLMFASVGVMLSSLSAEVKLPGAEIGVFLVLFFLMEWGYFVLFEVIWAGASPGKRALRLRVMQRDGRNLSLRESILRNLLRAADLLPVGYVVGGLCSCFDAHFRRLGDLAAGTIVVSEPRTHLETSRQEARREAVAGLPARLVLSRREREALSLFRERRERLSPARARELAEIVEPHFRSRFAPGSQAHAVELLLAIDERNSEK